MNNQVNECTHFNGKTYSHKPCNSNIFSKEFQDSNNIQCIDKITNGIVVLWKPDLLFEDVKLTPSILTLANVAGSSNQ